MKPDEKPKGTRPWSVNRIWNLDLSAAQLSVKQGCPLLADWSLCSMYNDVGRPAWIIWMIWHILCVLVKKKTPPLIFVLIQSNLRIMQSHFPCYTHETMTNGPVKRIQAHGGKNSSNNWQVRHFFSLVVLKLFSKHISNKHLNRQRVKVYEYSILYVHRW